MAGGVTTGVMAACYSKKIGAAYAGSFNPVVGGRRSYDGVTGFSSPTYLDTPGWSNWPAGGPVSALLAAGYTLQARYTMDRFEAINGSFTNHVYSLSIGGVDINDAVNTLVNAYDTGYFNVSVGASGAITFHDWLNNDNGSGGTAFVGNVTLYYQYTRS